MTEHEQQKEMMPQQVNKKSAGGEKDLIRFWAELYKQKGWCKYARFNPKGGLNEAYVLLKYKNMIDPETRPDKYKKGRPIAPQTKHPMRQLFHLAGRAWAFIANNTPGEHFIIPHGGKVPEFFKEAGKLKEHGSLGHFIKDIEGCYPHMPKEIIRFAMRQTVSEIRDLTSYEAVEIPKKETEACRWKTGKKARKGSIVIPTQDLLDIMEFALDNTFIKDRHGKIVRQTKGIPMGDPHSPGMAIITCAWMEKEWMSNLADRDKKFFQAKRFMDDILCIYAKNPNWAHEEFVKDFSKSEVYVKPLRLEDGKEATFLETRFDVKAQKIDFWLKNDNEMEKKIWRYNHFHSHCSFIQKRATLTACL